MSDGILSWVKYAREVEIHKAGNAQGLIDWYNNGADGQINWGSEGDFAACVAIAGKHIDNPEGFCQLRHIDATGAPTGHASGEIAKGDLMGHPFRGNQYANQEDYEQAKDVASKAKNLANFASKVQNTPDADPNKVHNLQDIVGKHAELARAHFDLADKTNGLVSQLHFQAALAHDSASKQAGDFARSGNRTNIAANASTASAASQVAAGVPISKADDEPDYTKLISDRKGEPSDQKLYNQVKSDAKKKFDTYPSAVANGWVVQEYKRRGGTYHKPAKA